MTGTRHAFSISSMHRCGKVLDTKLPDRDDLAFCGKNYQTKSLASWIVHESRENWPIFRPIFVEVPANNGMRNWLVGGTRIELVTPTMSTCRFCHVSRYFNSLSVPSPTFKYIQRRNRTNLTATTPPQELAVRLSQPLQNLLVLSATLMGQ